LLQVQLRSDTHEHALVKVIVVGNKGLCGSSTGNGIHQRGLNLSEVAILEVVAKIANNLGSGAENIAGAVVHDEIKVTLTETLL
jgi:hypothetical protein